jgi:hypothetical protein
MAADWIPCASGFIEADVIRWHESVWHKPRRHRGRAVNIGDRSVTAEVIRDQGGWVDLLVRDCEVVREPTNRKVAPLPKDEEVRRKRRSIEKGKPERLLWSDETARALLVSRFLDAEKEAPSTEAAAPR